MSQRETEQMNGEYLSYLESAHLNCEDIERLVDPYVDGELPQPLQIRVEDHVQECESCASTLEDCQRLLSLARTLDEAPLPSQIRTRLRDRLREELQNFQPRLRVIK